MLISNGESNAASQKVLSKILKTYDLQWFSFLLGKLKKSECVYITETWIYLIEIVETKHTDLTQNFIGHSHSIMVENIL